VAGLSGRHSELGVGVRNGVMLAVDTLNKAGGVNGRLLEIVVKDNKGDPGENAAVLNELIQAEIPIIIGPLLSKMAESTISTISGKNVMVASPTISTDLLVDKDDNFLRLIPESSFQGESIASAVNMSEYKRLAVVYDSANAAYTKPIVDAFKQSVESAEVVYVNDLSGGQEKKLAEVASLVIDSGCEALFLVTSSIDAGELCQQIRKRDESMQFYGAYWVKSGRIVEIGGRSVDGMILSTIFERSEKSAEYKDFAQRFENRFKTTPNFTSVYAYESVMVIAEGIMKSKSTDPRKVKDAIIAQGTFQGLEENFRINQYGDVERSKSLVQIRNGRFVRVDH